MDNKRFILYDGRARTGNSERATVLTVADTEKECRQQNKTYGKDSIWFEYELGGVDGKTLINEKQRPDLSNKVN